MSATCERGIIVKQGICVALLIDDAPDTDAVEAFAERIVAAFTDPFPLTDAEVIATATVGVATSADSADAERAAARAPRD